MANVSKNISVSWGFTLGAIVPFIILLFIECYFVPQLPNSTKGILTNLSAAQIKQLLALILSSVTVLIYLVYFRSKFLFSVRWLIAAMIYNFLILFVKFFLSASQYTNQISLNSSSVFSTAILVSLLYIGTFLILYLCFDGKILSKSLHKSIITTNDGKILLAMGLFIIVTVARISLFKLPVLSGTSAASYLGGVFATNSLVLSGLIFAMIVAAVYSFANVRRRVDLKYFFGSGVILIEAYHLAWAIFITRMHS